MAYLEAPLADDWSVLPMPEPTMGTVAYLHERQLALAADPRRAENWEKYLRSRRTCDVVDYLPVKMDIENVSRCNFRCTMCQVSDWVKGKRAEDMPFDKFKALMDELYSLVEIKLQGMGEPTLQGEDYFKMIAYARRTHVWVRTTTNASLLHLKDNYKRLIDADPNEVQISIDGADKEVFEGIRRGSRFDMVIRNCETINAYSQASPRTKMWTVIQKANIHQLDDLVRLAADTGFTCLTFSLDLTAWGQESWERTNRGATVQSRMTLARCLGLIELGKKLGVTVSFWRNTDKYDHRHESTMCPWPFERAYISSDGRTVPCCTIANPQVADLGPAFSFIPTWYGDIFVKFRRGHLSGDIPTVCRECYKKF